MRSTTTVQAKGYQHLAPAIEAATSLVVSRASGAVNQALVVRNWRVGRHVVEYQQGGHDRAKDGARLLERRATDLAARGVKGCSHDMLERMRGLFLTYPQIGSEISAPAVRKSALQQTVALNLSLLKLCRSCYQIYPRIGPTVSDRFGGGWCPVRTRTALAAGGMDNRLFVSRYLAALPSADQLKAFVERDRARLEAFHSTKRKGRR